MSWFDQVSQFVISLFIYFVIFSAIGTLFYALDRWVRKRISRSVHCAHCGQEVEASLLQKEFGKCPSCGRRQPGQTVIKRSGG